jgi:hypothetical protein
MREQTVTKTTKPSWFNWSLITGFDIFISYRHGRASEYAESLRNALTAAGFKCFLDEHEPDASLELAAATRKALRKSSMLVVIGTPELAESRWVSQEIAIARSSRRIKIVPISVGGWLAGPPLSAPAMAYLQNLAWIDESEEAFVRGVPSPEVVKGIKLRFSRLRVNTLTRGLATATIAVLAASTVIALL